MNQPSPALFMQTHMIYKQGEGSEPRFLTDQNKYGHGERARLANSRSELYTYVPPAFLARRDWPQEAVVVPDAIDLGSDGFARAYQTVSPFPLVTSGPQRSAWASHGTAVHKSMAGLAKKQRLDADGAAALLQIAIRGLHHVVASLDVFTTIDDGEPSVENGQSGHVEPRLPASTLVRPQAERVFPEALQRLKTRLPGRRFVVGMFHFVSGHWVSFVFDRLHFHLFMFDTLASDGRERLEMVATAW
ncbi:hypothetical protein OCS_06270 [Ophiocordyceps sinensis CO18]|uniref:Uncharacterized protein n=1 Tax=Ophiocordyceps sinensis (strain Co18 / CGMCC 3.14243) TaxID=911162 RepID=T5A867_OPHSC|nr:hypothetical protein OCS_06270 [Ophiocordyceps sinensis CO18]